MNISKSNLAKSFRSWVNFSRTTVSVSQRLKQIKEKQSAKSEVKKEDIDYISQGEKIELKENHYFKLLSQVMKHKKEEIKSKLSKKNQEEEEPKLSKDEFNQTLREAEAELSDYEYESKSDSAYKFRQPPKSHSENLNVLAQADARYEKSKKFLDGKLIDSDDFSTSGKNLIQEELGGKLPNNFSITNLQYPKTNSNVILLGVERQSYMHAYLISDLLIRLNPKVIFTQLSPDEPFLIRKPKNHKDKKSSYLERLGKNQDEFKGYKQYWQDFMNGAENVDFYVNPGPHFLTDAMVLKNKTVDIIEQNLLPMTESFDIGANIAYSLPIDGFGDDLKADWFLTTLVHQYNNLDSNIQLVFGGYPILATREHITRNYTLKELEEFFRITIQKYANKEFEFDPQYLMIDHWIKPQAEYMAELLRQSWYSSEKIVAVVDKEMIPHIEESWRKLPKIRKLVEFYKQIPEFSKDDTFIEYVQRHVVTDIMLDSFVNDYFMEYKYFPFSGIGLTGWQSGVPNLEHFWVYYYNEFMRKFNKNKVSPIEEEIHLKKMKYQDKKSQDFEKMFKNIEKDFDKKNE